MKNAQSLTVTGVVTKVDTPNHLFQVKCESDETVDIHVALHTSFLAIKNLGDDDVVTEDNASWEDVETILKDKIQKDHIVIVEGIEQSNDGKPRFDARTVHLLRVDKTYRFEDTHWWIAQTARLADSWLDCLFGDRRTYEFDDWVKLYQTDMNISGLPRTDNVQECAVLSRLIYGLSAAYLIVGDARYRKAAEVAVRFQREVFRSLSHDGKYCFWAFGRRKVRYGAELFRVKLLMPSENPDDKGSIPLYEQIYALAGLANYYRITLDWEVLQDIRRTVHTFNDFFLDKEKEDEPGFESGYFSHIGYPTMRPHENANPDNNRKKNWNSIGDHIPAYLVNVLLAIDLTPEDRKKVKALDLTPEDRKKDKALEEFLRDTQKLLQKLLERVTTIIINKFCPDDSSRFVNERFDADWNPDHKYRWQKNRAVVGHNFKIAWNLARVANYYDTLDQDPTHPQPFGNLSYKNLANKCMEKATQLCKDMTNLGTDKVRGGCFDLVERTPEKDMLIQFTTAGNTKAFWQQEQAILAYLILYGRENNTKDRELYIRMARQMEAFWNIFFLDHENSGMYFQVTDNGVPLIKWPHGVRGGHSDASGYHCFELNYLGHIYNRVYVSPHNNSDASEASFCLHFKPDHRSGMRSINVLPDFMPPGRVEIDYAMISGHRREHKDKSCFEIELTPGDLGEDISVQFKCKKC